MDREDQQLLALFGALNEVEADMDLEQGKALEHKAEMNKHWRQYYILKEQRDQIKSQFKEIIEGKRMVPNTPKKRKRNT